MKIAEMTIEQAATNLAEINIAAREGLIEKRAGKAGLLGGLIGSGLSKFIRNSRDFDYQGLANRWGEGLKNFDYQGLATDPVRMGLIGGAAGAGLGGLSGLMSGEDRINRTLSRGLGGGLAGAALLGGGSLAAGPISDYAKTMQNPDNPDIPESLSPDAQKLKQLNDQIAKQQSEVSSRALMEYAPWLLMHGVSGAAGAATPSVVGSMMAGRAGNPAGIVNLANKATGARYNLLNRAKKKVGLPAKPSKPSGRAAKQLAGFTNTALGDKLIPAGVTDDAAKILQHVAGDPSSLAKTLSSQAEVNNTIRAMRAGGFLDATDSKDIQQALSSLMTSSSTGSGITQGAMQAIIDDLKQGKKGDAIRKLVNLSKTHESLYKNLMSAVNRSSVEPKVSVNALRNIVAQGRQQSYWTGRAGRSLAASKPAALAGLGAGLVIPTAAPWLFHTLKDELLGDPQP